MIKMLNLCTIFEKRNQVINVWGFFDKDLNGEYFRYIPKRNDFQAFDEEPGDIVKIDEKDLRDFVKDKAFKYVKSPEEATKDGWYYIK